ncbi:hypothetical protein AURDEDRAFT_171422 [Auricularia subglabra TFB-10046 SS5]|nr:hypothetical protein AURDEDRAFT_171422 [Auricularia subglabra TFB-10046 SS5]
MALVLSVILRDSGSFGYAPGSLHKMPLVRELAALVNICYTLLGLKVTRPLSEELKRFIRARIILRHDCTAIVEELLEISLCGVGPNTVDEEAPQPSDQTAIVATFPLPPARGVSPPDAPLPTIACAPSQLGGNIPAVPGAPSTNHSVESPLASPDAPAQYTSAQRSHGAACSAIVAALAAPFGIRTSESLTELQHVGVVSDDERHSDTAGSQDVQDHAALYQPEVVVPQLTISLAQATPMPPSELHEARSDSDQSASRADTELGNDSAAATLGCDSVPQESHIRPPESSHVTSLAWGGIPGYTQEQIAGGEGRTTQAAAHVELDAGRIDSDGDNNERAPAASIGGQDPDLPRRTVAWSSAASGDALRNAGHVAGDGRAARSADTSAPPEPGDPSMGAAALRRTPLHGVGGGDAFGLYDAADARVNNVRIHDTIADAAQESWKQQDDLRLSKRHELSIYPSAVSSDSEHAHQCHFTYLRGWQAAPHLCTTEASGPLLLTQNRAPVSRNWTNVSVSTFIDAWFSSIRTMAFMEI